MEAKVSIQTAEEKDILLIPGASVNYSSDGIFCYVLKDGVIEKRNIETGISDDEYIEYSYLLFLINSLNILVNARFSILET